MSQTILHGFDKNGEIFEINAYGNAWHGAILMWMKMGEKYNIPDVLAMIVNEKISKKIWGLASDPKVAESDRITMMTTFDRCVVGAKDFNRLIKALRESAQWLPPYCHISKQANDIENLKDIIAVGWTQTSVVDDIWSSRECKDDEEIPYNLNKHNLHFNLFEEHDAHFCI
jgi:hypothetical protein